jgi:hypothetical protein
MAAAAGATSVAAPWAAGLPAAAQGPAHAAPSPSGEAPSLPQAPEPGTAGGSAASSAGSGVAFSLLFALLFSFAAFALQHYSRLRLPPARSRFFRFVAVVERPG